MTFAPTQTCAPEVPWLSLFVSALLGRSRLLSAGPSALLSLLIVTQAEALAVPGSLRCLALAPAAAPVAAAMQVSIGFVPMGGLNHSLCAPVLSGSTSAPAFIIASSHRTHQLGVQVPTTHHLHDPAGSLSPTVTQTACPTVVRSTTGALLFQAFPYLLPLLLARRKTFPDALAQLLPKSRPIAAVTAGPGVLAAFERADRNAVRTTGGIPRALPRFASCMTAPCEFPPSRSLVLTVRFLQFVENLSAARTVPAKIRRNVDSKYQSDTFPGHMSPLSTTAVLEPPYGLGTVVILKLATV